MSSRPYDATTMRDAVVLHGMAEELCRKEARAPLRLMHVCGTHENVICRYSLRELLPSWVTVVAGPGCPVCVCPAGDIDAAAQAAAGGAIVATFGDMVQVPAQTSLARARAEGGDVRVVAGAHDAVRIARDNPGAEVVFFAAGFETTACTTAAAILESPPENFSVLSAHRVIRPALSALLGMPEVRVDGFLMPGHVHTVIGTQGFDELAREKRKPMVVAGFEPADVLRGVSRLVDMAIAAEHRLDNVYRRAVRSDGNPKARAAMDRVFEIVDAEWRGLGTIPLSGLALQDDLVGLDARRRFGLRWSDDSNLPTSGCRCGEVMVGLCEPEQCPLFARRCTPDSPQGACMVGAEGTCKARFVHRKTVS